MEYRQPTQAEFMGDFVAKYKQQVRPLLLQEETEFVKVLITDLVMRYSLYLQTHHQGSGGSPEANYQFAVGALKLLVDSSSTQVPVEKILTEVDGQVGKLELKLKDNADFQRQTREQLAPTSP